MADVASSVLSKADSIKGIMDLFSHGAKTGADALSVTSDAADKILTQHQGRINSMLKIVGIIIAVCFVCVCIIGCCSSLIGGGGFIVLSSGKKNYPPPPSSDTKKDPPSG